MHLVSAVTSDSGIIENDIFSAELGEGGLDDLEARLDAPSGVANKLPLTKEIWGWEIQQPETRVATNSAASYGKRM